MGSLWSSSAGCNRVQSAPLPDFVFESRSFVDLFATCPTMDLWISLRSLPGARWVALEVDKLLCYLYRVARTLRRIDECWTESCFRISFILNSFIEIPFKALANPQYIFIEKIASDLHVKCRFHIRIVSCCRSNSRQPNMEGNFLIALRAARISPEKARHTEESDGFGLISKRASPISHLGE